MCCPRKLHGEADILSWVQRFNDITQENGNASLPVSLSLPTPCPPQAEDFQVPESCKLPSTNQLPPPVEHSHYCHEENGQWTLAGLEKLVKSLKAERRGWCWPTRSAAH